MNNKRHNLRSRNFFGSFGKLKNRHDFHFDGTTLRANSAILVYTFCLKTREGYHG